jgi:hypothetical protein
VKHPHINTNKSFTLADTMLASISLPDRLVICEVNLHLQASGLDTNTLTWIFLSVQTHIHSWYTLCPQTVKTVF